MRGHAEPEILKEVEATRPYTGSGKKLPKGDLVKTWGAPARLVMPLVGGVSTNIERFRRILERDAWSMTG